MDANALPEERLRMIFEKWWPDLELSLSGILQNSQEQTESTRSDADLIKEVLETVRDQHKILLKMQERDLQHGYSTAKKTSNTETDNILPENIEGTRTFVDSFIKANRKLIILLFLSRKPMIGYDIIKEIFLAGNVFLPQNSVYSILYALEEEGLLESSVGNERRAYSITSSGKGELTKLLESYDEGMQLINNLICCQRQFD